MSLNEAVSSDDPLRAHLFAILSGVAMLIVGVSLLFSVIGLRAGMAEFSTVVTGLISSAYFAGYVVGVLVCPILVSRVGHVRAFAAMASLASTMPILHALWVNPWFWGGLRLIAGICLVGLYIVIESWLNTLAPKSKRGQVFSIYLVVTFVSLALGQWLILVGDAVGFVPFAMVSVLLSFALLPITMARVQQPDTVESPRLSLHSLWQTSPLGVAGAFVSGLISGAFFGLGAVFADRVGFDAQGVAAFMALTILGGAVLQWPVGRLSDRMDRRLVLLGCCLGSAALGLTGYGLSIFYPTWLIGLGALLGGLIFTIYGLGIAHANDQIHVSRTLEVTGGLLLVHGIGAAVGPTIAGVVMDLVGPGSLMLYFTVAAGGLALYTAHRMRVAAPVPVEEKVDFVAMGSGTQTTAQLDPRTPDPSDPADAASFETVEADEPPSETVGS